MITIYHNPRCRKSREGLAVVEASGKPFKVVKYLDNRLSKSELQQILATLSMGPMEIVRKQEAIWKSEFKGKEMSEEMILNALVEHPKLIERPIVMYNQKGVIGRPSENIADLLSD
ncbi:arsenate reductase (glutaredoxin) [Muriicola soli]|uniref:Arsenate reductase (Glutaredoxin) n=1 Tax=Muriicola soli TaxID=2507538 RepID=A0A411E985_9FLAO|nr:arsenate reductase (glutaredoxin) [Muriicola soli]QBA64295.1 arsenate reductase (glutaredoxin) [Muriicola soli]